MKRYKIWDEVESIITPAPDPSTGKQVYTPEEFKVYNPLAAVPGMKFIISSSKINGAVIMETTQTAQTYRQMGADIPEDATPEEIAEAIEFWEDEQARKNEEIIKESQENEKILLNAQLSALEAQERQAAMMEYQTLLML